MEMRILIGSVVGLMFACQATAANDCKDAVQKNDWGAVTCIEDLAQWQCREMTTDASLTACFARVMRQLDHQFGVGMELIKIKCSRVNNVDLGSQGQRGAVIKCNWGPQEGIGDPVDACVRVSADYLRCCDPDKLRTDKLDNLTTIKFSNCPVRNCPIGTVTSKKCFGKSGGGTIYTGQPQ
jgi:hypothetical protein